MRSAKLEPRRLLDPRPADVARVSPLADAVNIPVAELSARTHELPPRTKLIEVAAWDESAAEARALLEALGRRVSLVSGAPFAPPGTHHEIGRLWEPTPLLARFAKSLPPGNALELACGTGRDAVYLASIGWSVTAIDILPDAIDRAVALAQRCADAIEPITWIATDIEADEFSSDARYDLITGFRYLHRPLFSKLGSWLRPGGSVIYETFTTAHRARFGKPAQDAHVLEPRELASLLSGFEILHHVEDWNDAGHTAQVVARAR